MTGDAKKSHSQGRGKSDDNQSGSFAQAGAEKKPDRAWLRDEHAQAEEQTRSLDEPDEGSLKE